MEKGTNLGQNLCEIKDNVMIADPQPLPNYHGPATWSSSTQEGRQTASPTTNESSYGTIFPIPPTLYHPQPISPVHFQPDQPNLVLGQQANNHTDSNFRLTNSAETFSICHLQQYSNNLNHDQDRATTTIVKPLPMNIDDNYEAMIQYDSRLDTTQSHLSHTNDLSQPNGNGYPQQQQYYWNYLPTYLAPNPIMIPDPFEIGHAQHFLQPNSAVVPEQQVTDVHGFQSMVPNNYIESSHVPTDPSKSKRLKSSHDDTTSTHQVPCPSADTSFSSSTDDGSANELHIIETSMSSCELLEPPNYSASSSPTHTKYFESSSHDPARPLQNTIGTSDQPLCSPSQDFFINPATTHRKRSRSIAPEKPSNASSSVFLQPQHLTSYPAVDTPTTSKPSDTITTMVERNSKLMNPPIVEPREESQSSKAPETSVKIHKKSVPSDSSIFSSTSPSAFQDSSRLESHLVQNLNSPTKQTKKQSSTIKRKKKERANSIPQQPDQRDKEHRRSNSSTSNTTINPQSKPTTTPPISSSSNRKENVTTMTENENHPKRKHSLQNALEALDTLTDYLSKDVNNNVNNQFVTPQHFFVLGELGGRLRRRLDFEKK